MLEALRCKREKLCARLFRAVDRYAIIACLFYVGGSDIYIFVIRCKGNCIFWGDTYNTTLNNVYKAFADDIADATGLVAVEKPTEKAKDYGGGFENWFRHTYNRPGICIELSENKNTILPCGNENYIDFEGFVNYTETSNAIAAAMASENK